MDTSRIPHKNLIASGAVALLIIVVGVFVNKDIFVFPDFTSNDTPENKMAIATEERMTERDSDGDLLLDWEERLRGTDPFKTDSDGDGTFDGKELSLGRDPMKPAPNDELPALAGINFATSSTDLAGIKKEYFAKYLASAGRDVRETTFRDVIDGFDPKKYKPTTDLLDLNVSSDVSNEALRTYGNGFGALINKYTATKLRTEEEIFEEGMKTKNDASLRDLKYLIIVYSNFAKDLRAMPVPLPLAKHHLLVINGYDGMAKGLTGMSRMFTSPIDGAAGYQVYTRMRMDVTLGYSGVVGYFAEKAVTFNPTEPGFPFYYNTTALPQTANGYEVEDLSELEKLEQEL